MLKKIIIGLISFIVLAVIGAGVYIYTLDWNKHKALIAQRFSQITGLNAVIDGQLNVELFPSPKFSAGLVKFYKNGNTRDPLMNINQISSNVELMPLFDNKFILKSMTLTQPTVNLEISEQGEFNWSGFGASGQNKSGNIEVSFNDIRMNSATFKYNNLRNKKSFQLTNISANISAPTLQGPYKTNGSFIHNNSEIKFNGDIVKNNDVLTLKMTVENAPSAAKIFIDGTLGNKAKGTLTFETKSLTDTIAVMFGKDTISDVYKEPLYFSFKYDYDNNLAKLDNFTVKYGQHSIGTGSAVIKNGQPRGEISANFDMTQFNINLIENISRDYINMVNSGKKFGDMFFSNYDSTLNIKAGQAFVNGTEAKNLNLGLKLKDGVLDLTRLGVIMAGDTSLKAVGKINLNNGVDYQFNQVFETNDLRTFASVFGIDLAKLANPEQKKSIFKRAQAEIKISGDLGSMKVFVPNGLIDATSFKGNFGFVKKDGEQYVLADVNASQILFDKYLAQLPKDKAGANLEDKVIYQLNLIPWNKDINLDITATVGSAVYHEVPIEKMQLQFTLSKENLAVKKFAAANFGGGAVNMSFEADKVYSKPYFKELSFDVKTNNFPLFSNTLGIKNLTKPLFKRKLFAAQGALSGTFDHFSLSSVQKFGDTEFSYTGTVENTKEAIVDGDLELKSNNFSNFIKALDIDYTPDLPLTSFMLKGKIKGTSKLFALDDVNAYLGANNIKGHFDFDNSEKTPKLAGQFDFDKFDADRLFNLNKKAALVTKATKQTAFVALPDFDEKKIDYSSLKKADFNLALSAKQLIYKNKTYANAQTNAMLKSGILKVDNFSFVKDDMSVLLKFMLNSNNMAKAEGSFNISGLPLLPFGGTVYMIEGGTLSAEGTFSSSAGSIKEFIENLNARGKFTLLQTAMKGWDLDIIKFEFEQRKTLKGFEDTIMNSLKTGRSIFTKISGNYEVTQGLLISDNTFFESPVAKINMKFDLNLSDRLFNAVFNGIYNNATFSDVLKFSYTGNLSDPQLKLNLSESIKRIRDTENMINEAKNSQEKAQKERLSEKTKALSDDLNNELQNISRLTLDTIRFKPISNNENVVKVYEQSLKTLQDSETKLKLMADTLRTHPNEEILMNLGAELEIEKSKIKFVPKTLEDNFIVDSKYIFDEAFNKISWLYNAAQNNASYYSGLSDVYMQQVDIMANTDTPVDEAKQKALQNGIDDINDDIERINGLYNKIRDNYLNIIDSQKISEMKKNNEAAKQALETIFVYTERMNNKIVDSIEDFRAALNINARDYDEYMVYLPKTIDSIDASKPATGSKQPAESKDDNIDVKDKKQTEASSKTDNKKDVADKPDEEEIKKKDDILSLNINSVKGGIASLIKKIKTNTPKTAEVKVAQLDIQSPVIQTAVIEKPETNKNDVKPVVAPKIKETVPDSQEEIKKEVKKEKVIKGSKEEVIEEVQKEVKTVQTAEKKQPVQQKETTENKQDKQKEIIVAQNIQVPVKPVIEKKSADKKAIENLKPVLTVKEEKKEVKIAEQVLPTAGSDYITATDEQAQQTLLSSDRQTSVIQTAEAQTVLPAPVKTAAETLLENTKSAMNDIMAKIKQTESNVKSLFIENEENQKAKVLAYKQQFPSFKKELSGNFFGKSGTAQNSFFKTNPVVALGIGKDENSLISAEIADSLSRKQGFSRSKNIPSIALSGNNLAFHIASTENDGREDTFQSPLIKLLSDERLDDDFAVKLSHLTDDVPVYIETPNTKVEQSSHKYVFSTTDGAALPFSGTSGKSALKDENSSDVHIKKEHKYLFAQNQLPSRIFSGEISKAKTLYVK
ncbi:MAG: AsmA family protein [Alphaproteobacteria bacterium]|nr:AsmA family protein [Alphaproteobacteria bacterium]